MMLTPRRLVVGAVVVALLGGGATTLAAGAATGKSPGGTRLGWVMAKRGAAAAAAAEDQAVEGAAEAQAPAPRSTIVLRGRSTNEKFVDEDRNNRDSAGDEILFTEDLVQPDGQVVGYDSVKQTITFRGGALVDEATFVLRGRGKIEIGGFYSFFADALYLPITGGTGEFRGATGVVVIDDFTEVDQRFTFRLA